MIEKKEKKNISFLDKRKKSIRWLKKKVSLGKVKIRKSNKRNKLKSIIMTLSRKLLKHVIDKKAI